MTPEEFEIVRHEVNAFILEKHSSKAWLNSPYRDPKVIKAHFTKEPLSSVPLEFYDKNNDEWVLAKCPTEYMYTAKEMKDEIERRLKRAMTVDPRAHPDYAYTTFSMAELLEHVVPFLPKDQPGPVNREFRKQMIKELEDQCENEE